MMEAGAPEGLLNVVHGDKEAVDAILAHDDIKAVSFVGSSDIAIMSIKPAPPTANASKLWEGRKIMASSCRMQIWTK